MRINYRATYCPTAIYSVLCALAAAAAHSQAPVAGGSGATPPSDSTALEEIVVSAERRNARLQDVPIAVEAVTGAELASRGIGDTSSLVIAAPSLDFSRQGSAGGTPYLRGVGSSVSNAGWESSVAVYVDDIYQMGPDSNLFSLSNIDRVEILKGPQGTLFGRNATGGVIQVFTKDPSFDPAADVSLSYANYQTTAGSFYGTTGLSQSVAANLSVEGSDQHEGWGRSLSTGAEIFRDWNYSVRPKLLWKISDTTTVHFSADYSQFNNDLGVNLSPIPGTFALTGKPFPGKYDAWSLGKDFDLGKVAGLGAKLESEMDWATLVSITSYRDYRNNLYLDQDMVAQNIVGIPYHQFSHDVTQETQLRSRPDAKSQWLLGTFVLDSRAGYDPLDVNGTGTGELPGASNRTISSQNTTSFALFGQDTFQILPRTDLTTGVRYTRDEYTASGSQETVAANGSVSAPTDVVTQTAAFPKVTYRGALDYKFTDDVFAYISRTRGFKSGGYNLAAYSQAAVAPEILDSTEAGLKSEWFDRRLRFNLSAFYYNYTNIQVQYVEAGANYAVNAGGAHIKGLEAELVARPIQALTLSASLSVLDGHYTSFPNSFTFTANPPDVGGNTQINNENNTGHTTVRTPKSTSTLTASYAVPIQFGALSVDATVYHNSGFYWDPDNVNRQPSYTLLNAAIRWQNPNDKYEVKVWGNNLLQQYYYTFFTETTFGDQYSPAAPRTFGITLSEHF